MNALLIPSAKLIPREMRKYLGDIPTVLYPLDNKTMLELLSEHYKQYADKSYVIACEKKELIHDYESWKHTGVEIIDIDTTRDLGHTVGQALKQLLATEKELSKVYINYADTLLTDIDLEGLSDAAFYKMDVLSYKWTFYMEENGTITSLIDKSDVASTDHKEQQAFFVGVFCISDPKLFMECLEEAYGSEEPTDSIYRALMHYSKLRPIEFLKDGTWFDVGHSENYMKAKTGVAAREFNTVDIDKDRGILRKTSKNREKLIGEISWFLKLPQNLQYLTPRIYAYSLDRNCPYVEMEYYGYHTLHEVLIMGNKPLLEWQKILEKLRFCITDMCRFKVSDTQNGEIQKSLKEMYITKTIDRMNQLKNNEAFRAYFENKIILNGQVYPSLNEIMEQIESVYTEAVLSGFDGEFAIIHGDLCFSNVLIEENAGFVRLIDPRGKFGNFDIYGDPDYELAKIAHSLEGQYDYIIEDMFRVQTDGNRIELELPNNAQTIFQLFCDIFDLHNERLNAVRFIEATLFLSMIPLHSDYPNRQIAMLGVGLQLFDQVCKDLRREKGEKA